MFDRLIKLIGEDNFNKIQNTKVLLIGVGGVGSATLETLVRNGFTNIHIIDFDTVDLTNLNRQLITNSTNLGNKKIDEAIKRAKLINPNSNIKGMDIKLDDNNIANYIDDYDYIIDACDTMSVKYKLIELSMSNNFKLIESMGTAKKLDPTKLSITTLDKTEYDPIAKILRKMCRDNRISTKKVHVVSSIERPLDIKDKAASSIVPNTAGIYLATYVINDIIKK
ncbi:MAG: ThiF family adenylyltransferase [Bacilli bacterium]|nr:ThiF family adenylyltransferase [Bacilli bacterium]